MIDDFLPTLPFLHIHLSGILMLAVNLCPLCTFHLFDCPGLDFEQFLTVQFWVSQYSLLSTLPFPTVFCITPSLNYFYLKHLSALGFLFVPFGSLLYSLFFHTP